MNKANITKIQCQIIDSNKIKIEGSVYLEQNQVGFNTIRAILDPTAIDDQVRRNFIFPAQLHGTSELGEEIFISKFWRTSEGHHYHPKYTIEWTGSAEQIYIGVGLDEIVNKNQKISIQFAIPSSALSASSPHIDHSIGKLNIQETPQVNLTWENGDYKCSLYNLFIPDRKIGNSISAINVEKKSFVSVEFVNKNQTTFKQAVFDAVDSFEEILPLLGFLGLRRLDWYELEAAVVLGKDRPRVLEISARKSLNLPTVTELYSDTDWLYVPITKKALENKIIDLLILNLKSHKNSKALVRAIEYLLSSYEEKYLFSKLVAAYTAFETLVADLSKTNKIDTTLHGKEYVELQEYIFSYLCTYILNEEQRANILQKIPELKRPPIKSTFKKLFNHQDYPLTRFMFNNSDWHLAMGQLISRRNTLVHAGEIKQEHYLDLHRLHLLLQIWVLKLLNCPDEYVNEYLANSVRNLR